ncbi:hypothetical protein H6P81_000543 [Aristolochia fimbriata]|uniref:Uncharacterized protein n=1 Tax=Aristolochia fimbriata TaxID=158543 RepID=A0AAV7F4D4_ARIFI|nr:hypothetical protein H6P81_000543 [Aristolochia fimbriata]
MGVMGILSESFRVPFRLGRLGILLAFSLILPSSILFIANVFALRPFYLDIHLKSNEQNITEKGTPRYDELFSGMEKDVRVIMGEEAAFFLAGSILQLLATVAAIYASGLAHWGQKVSPRDLFVRVGSIWRRPLITWLCIGVFKLGYLFLLVLFVGLLVLITQLGTTLFSTLAILVTLSGLLYYLYLGMVWELGLVISVMEEGSQGFSALGKAGELIKGRRLQGLLLYLLFTITEIALFWFFWSHRWFPKFARTGVVPLAIAVTLTCLSCLIALFSTVVYTVFYCVCKESRGEEIEAQETSGYSLIPNTIHVDAMNMAT